MMARERLRRTLVALLALVIGGTGSVAAATGPVRAAEPGKPGWVTDLESGKGAKAGEPVPWRGSSSAPLGRSRPTAPPAFAFPKAGAGDGTVAVKPRGGKAAPRVQVLDRAAAKRVGASGFVFTVTGQGGGRSPAGVTVDYGAFANAYGAGYADRLRVVALRDCAIANPVPAGCDIAGVPLAARNDRTANKLAADINVDGADAAVYAVTADVGGDEGTFAASSLSVSGSWQVAPGSGEFSYSYPVDVPAPGGGSAPSVGLGYSSGAVDGLTLATNTQASPAGLGWSDFANAYIERRYEPCFRNIGTADLCWKSDNATISLNGLSGPLIPVDAARTQWRVQSDPGWKAERLNDAQYANIYQKQRWRVTGPDGTAYDFGLGHMPGRQTNSVLAVPVIADNTGEPCRGANDTVGGCDQGWRWYLDRVTDPDGNVRSLLYEREANYYSAVGGLAGNDGYHRGALLKEIIYGGRGWDADSYSARVTFGLQWRCGFLVEACPAPTADSTGFPDVPVDLICTATSACSVHAPSFFTGRRYASVRTDVKVGTVWKPVAQHNLYHSFGDTSRGTAYKLRLDSIQHAAIAFGKLNAYPHTSFTYGVLHNRVDHGGATARMMKHDRIIRVTNPFGGTTSVTYFRNRACADDYNPWPRWDTNEQDCFPQSVKDGAHLRTGVFNKWLVQRVVESPGGGSPDMTTGYAYQEEPVWAFDTGAFARDEDETGWAVWRGYGTVTITKGTSRTQLRLFRGLDQDPMLVQDGSGDWVPLGKRAESVRTFDGTATYVDHRSLGGRTLEERQLGTLDAVPDSVLESRRYEYERRITHDPGDDYLFDAEWVGPRSTTESVATAPGVFRQRRSQTTHNAHFQPTTTLEEGWLDQTGDERCSITTYADDPSRGMYVYPASNTKVAGDCASTQVLTRSETYYNDNGNPIRQRTLVENGRWSETTSEYDALGRPVKVTGPTGGVTSTSYGVTAGAPATQIPIRTTVTNPVGHQTVTSFHPEFGVPSREQDANGNVTEYGYDEFGRLETVWLPDAPVDFAEPSLRFSYDIPNRTVRSRQLTSQVRCCEGATFDDTWVVYDGFWRERQVQGRSPVSGRVLLAETTYDGRGQLRDQTVEQAVAGTPGKYLTLPSGTIWQNRTRHQYDELGRDVRSEWFHGNDIAHATTTAYTVDTVTVTGPDGHKVRERVDGLGRTVAVEEHDGQGWASSAYRYDLADRLLSVTDPGGNRVDYTVNQAGWRVSQRDPDRGNATFTYDGAGNQTSATDAAGNQIHTSYDAAGRKLTRRSGSSTGPLLAEWVYDTAPGGKGRAHREITHTASGDWVSEVPGYDNRGRPSGSRLTAPAGIPGLSGQYEASFTYDRSGHVTSATYPAIGGLPREEVVTEYNAMGLPTRMAGLNEYVWGAGYDDRGRRTSAGLGPRPGGGTWMARNWTFNADQRPSGWQTYLGASNVVSQHDLAYDPAGNLKEKVTRHNGQSWRECFGYDARSRLTSAHTVPSSTSCADGQPGTGDKPYAHTYRYSPDGRLLERVENGVSTGYQYPSSGARPHAPTTIGAGTYTWDANGNLATRSAGGGTETYVWDVAGSLASVTGPAGTTGFVYDANGQRLMRRAPDGRVTLYAAGHEVTANADGTSVTAVRAYQFDGQLIATRTPAGVDYLVSDPAGSVEQSVPAGGTPDASRLYTPYGRVRERSGDKDTDRGFIGQVEDSSTGLSYLNARYYDPSTGVFASTDPVYDTSKVKSLNPYGYAANNPTTFTDPTGLYSQYTWGIEVENAQLKAQNKELLAHIRKLGNYIEDLQDIIRKQQKQINKLVTYVEALEAEISRQASIIRQLQARVAYLERVVVAQQREISRLRRVVARQQQIIRYQAGVINLQRDAIGYLLGELETAGWAIQWLRVSDAMGIRPHEMYNLIYSNLADGYSRDEVDQTIDLISMMRVTTAGETARMEGQRMVFDILSDHYAELAEIYDPVTFVCDMNSVGGGTYTILAWTKANPWVAAASAAGGIACTMR
ncbi:RHS repeat-associated core domain-containing protein [Phytohabitans aurantiacus]|nr:RHS repeat-associated core domain-containing protein [Phytohabitans aurantiacus]